MLTELYTLLAARLQALGYPMWAADAVPDNAAFPFVTAVIRPSASLLGTGRVTLTGWCRSDARHADRLTLADDLLKLVPPGGLLLPLTEGAAALFRGDRMAVEWPETPDALGVSVTHDLRVVGGAADA